MKLWQQSEKLFLEAVLGLKVMSTMPFPNHSEEPKLLSDPLKILRFKIYICKTSSKYYLTVMPASEVRGRA